MTQHETRATNVFRIDGEAASGWYWEQGRWITFTIDEEGEIAHPVNCEADEHRTRDYARIAMNMLAGRGGRITLNDEE